MALDNVRLSLLPFPQRWDGKRLSASVLVLPVGDPLNVPLFDNGAAFAGTPLALKLVIQSGTASFNANQDGNFPQEFTPSPTFANPRRLFATLEAQFSPKSPSNLAQSRIDRAQRLELLGAVYKVLPESYKTAVGLVEPRDPRYVLTEHQYACRMRGQAPGAKPAKPDDVSWGQVISYALKQPALARAMGLVYDFDTDFTGQDIATMLANGGWLHVALASSMAEPSIGWRPEQTACYAARIPALGAKARPLFAAVLFPDNEVLVGTDANLVPQEAMEYDDGFASAVHARQPATADAATEGGEELPPSADAGIQLGWDDEQVLAWVNRQLDNSRARGGAPVPFTHAPLGVAGYRIDVREHGGADVWHSLCGVVGDVALYTWKAHVEGEFAVDTPPQRPNLHSNVMMTLPRYFAAWRGSSLVLADGVAQQLATGLVPSSTWRALELPPPQPAHPPQPALRYGHSYDFRVRLADLTGGGPGVGDEAINPAPAPIASLRFERRVPPKAMRIEPDNAANPTLLTLSRPLLAYPDFVFAGVDATDDLVNELAKNLNNEPSLDFGVGIPDPDVTHVGIPDPDVTHVGIPDPDVTHVAITVQVLAPRGDAGGALSRDGEFVELYSVLKALPAPDGFPATSPHFADKETGLAVKIDYVDCTDIEAAASDLLAASNNGHLAVPTGRNLRLRIRPANLPAIKPSHFARELQQTFAGQSVALGLVAEVALRQEEGEPAELLDIHVKANDRCVAMMLQPLDVLGQSSPDPMQLIADALDLEADGMSLRGRPGRRVVFAATGALRHSLADGNGKITFAARDELYGHWLVARRVRLERDWTWTGLADKGIAIEYPPAGQVVFTIPIGEVALPFVVSNQASKGKEQQRGYTELVLFDAFQPADAKPVTGIAEVQTTNWRPRAMLRTGGDVVGTVCSLTVPIARAPRDLPAIASVGIARPVSHVPGADGNYASTPPMPKSLWIEFEEPLAVDGKHPDRGLKYFARVLGYGPDPLITPLQSIPLFGKFPEPPLPVDPEWIRVIHPGQNADRAGYDAMVELVPAEAANPGESIRHWLLPLPSGVDADSPALFGFWTYELRIGYGGDHWTTARARFGRPLRVTGVQHPVPEIVCNVHRSRGVQSHVLPKPNAPIFALAAQLSMETVLAQYQAPAQAVWKASGHASTDAIAPAPSVMAQYPASTMGSAELVGISVENESAISPSASDWITQIVVGGDIVVQAPFAVSLVDGQPITYAIAFFNTDKARIPYRVPTQPLSDLWALLYVQIEQADGGGQRNLLLARQPMPFAGDLERVTRDPSQWFGRTMFERSAVELQLAELGLPPEAALSVLVVELLPNDAARAATEVPPKADAAAIGIVDPLGLQLGRQRILRTSPLTPVQGVC